MVAMVVSLMLLRSVQDIFQGWTAPRMRGPALAAPTLNRSKAMISFRLTVTDVKLLRISGEDSTSIRNLHIKF
jgi:hypothetical protein